MKIFILLTGCLFSNLLFAQDMSHSKPGDRYYKELPNPKQANFTEWNNLANDINVSYASDNIRYPK